MIVKKFKCRASKGGDIMTNGRGKATMGETCVTYLKEWIIEQSTGQQRTAESKYFDHGNFAEYAAIQRASEHFATPLSKNEEHLENEHFTGTYDAKGAGIVIDTKCPWNQFTMPYFDDKPPKAYYNQLQIYMDLTGLKKAAVFYALENHSDDQIYKLAQRLAWGEGQDEPDMNHWNEAKSRLTFDHLPAWMRQKVYEFERDDALIDAMKERVELCRKIIRVELLPKFEKLKRDVKL